MNLIEELRRECLDTIEEVFIQCWKNPSGWKTRYEYCSQSLVRPNSEEVDLRVGVQGEIVLRYNKRGRVHREGGPAYIQYLTSPRILTIHYIQNGKRHRPFEEGPAFIKCDEKYILDSSYYTRENNRKCEKDEVLEHLPDPELKKVHLMKWF